MTPQKYCTVEWLVTLRTIELLFSIVVGEFVIVQPPSTCKCFWTQVARPLIFHLHLWTHLLELKMVAGKNVNDLWLLSLSLILFWIFLLLKIHQFKKKHGHWKCQQQKLRLKIRSIIYILTSITLSDNSVYILWIIFAESSHFCILCGKKYAGLKKGHHRWWWRWWQI